MENSDYDFIIIEAGSAGCVLANELSADASCKVLILEARPLDRSLFIHMPVSVYRVFRGPGLNWNYFTENEDGLTTSIRKIFKQQRPNPISYPFINQPGGSRGAEPVMAASTHSESEPKREWRPLKP